LLVECPISDLKNEFLPGGVISKPVQQTKKFWTTSIKIQND